DPTRTGYSFTGWDVTFTNVTGDITVTAEYEINTYTVTFNLNGGTRTGGGELTQTIEHGSGAIAPDFEVPEGKTFTGWSIEFSNISGDATIEAQYDDIRLTVRFLDHDTTVLKTETVLYGSAATAPDSPERDGYSFAGWSPSDFSNITSDTDVTAQYNINSYTVTFEDHDGTELKVETVEHGSGASAPDEPTREGYTFIGWSVEYSEVTSDITIVAQYEINTYTVTFNLNGGERTGGGELVQLVEYGADAVAPEFDSPEGKVFTEWSLDFTNVTADITVDAQYDDIQLTVRFLDHDETVLKTETVTYGAAATAPSEPEREGYTFTGWSPTDFSNITEDTDVIAQYEVNSYTVTFELNGGTRSGGGELVQSVAYGTAAIAPNVEAPEGWKHTGWDVEFNNVTEDLTVTATYRFIPVGQDLVVQTDQDIALDIVPSVMGEDGYELALEVISATSNGRVTVDGLTFNYQPNLDYVGPDSFTYTVTDGELTSRVYTVQIEVIPLDDGPDAVDDEYTVTRSSNDVYELPVMENDTDPRDRALVITTANVSLGNVEIIEGSDSDDYLRVSAASGFVGIIEIAYAIKNTINQGDTAQVRLTIEGNPDDDLPVIVVPEDKTIDATALFTRVNLGNASATDRLGRPVPVSLVDGESMFPPGSNLAYWRAEDYDGNVSYASQGVRVNPLISISKDQLVIPGDEVTITAYLNGDHHDYPVVIPYTLSGSAEEWHHSLREGEFVIESGRQASITFEVYRGEPLTEDLTLNIQLDETMNLGPNGNSTILITDRNIAPEVDLAVVQSGERRPVLARDEGHVTVTAFPSDQNKQDRLSLDWEVPFEAEFAVTNDSFTFDAEAVEVGIYTVAVTVTDDGDPSLSSREFIYVDVRNTLPLLGDGDANGNLLPDSVDGWGDDNNNGIPNYLDPFGVCDVIPERLNEGELFAIEAEPSLCIRKGPIAMEVAMGALQVFMDDTNGENVVAAMAMVRELADGLVPEDEFYTNVGGIFDAMITEMQTPGQTLRLAIPQRQPIPSGAVYRWLSPVDGWQTFSVTEVNALFSAAGEPGFCPPPGSELWQPGLAEGHHCVQVQMADGSTEDADLLANRVALLVGGVAVEKTQNNPPIAQNDAVEMPWNSSIQIEPLSNDTDEDGDTLRITSASAPVGEVSILTDSELEYTAPENYAGEVEIDYSISDGNGGVASAVIVVKIVANQAPVAVDDSASTDDRTAIKVNILRNDSDPDGDALTLESITANYGSVEINEDQTITYTPRLKFAGEDVLSYTINDGRGGTATAEVRITIKVVETIVVTNTSSKGGSMSALIIAVMVLFGAVRSGLVRARQLSLVGFAALLSLPAMAHQHGNHQQGDSHEQNPWQVRVQFGQAEASGSDSDFISQLPANATLVDSNYSDTSMGVAISYSFTPRLAAEVGYVDLGEAYATYQATTTNPEQTYQQLVGLQPILASGFTLGASYAFVNNEQWTLSVNGGLFAWESDLESQSATQVFRSSEDGSDLYFGLAAGLKLNEHWTLGVGYRSYQLDESISDLHATLSYRF
ncbi:Ig-like domain-containing protein, partial [Pseudidiomarina aestuarii]|uniref:Ig-like domain-containing protein n=1 Tax=Pseudidiomarina aestuarii TaxID=624146 RepID=UPI003A986D43